jgi:hypothetical protein
VTTALPAAYLRGAGDAALAAANQSVYGTPYPSEITLKCYDEYGSYGPDDAELIAADLRRSLAALVALMPGARGGHALAAFDYDGRDYDECYAWGEFFGPRYDDERDELEACISQGPDALAAFLERHEYDLPKGIAETLRRIVALSDTSPETFAAIVAPLLAALTTPAGETLDTQAHGPPSSRRVHCRQRRHLIASAVSDDPAPSRRSTLNVYGDSCRRSSLTLGGYVAPLP